MSKKNKLKNVRKKIEKANAEMIQEHFYGIARALFFIKEATDNGGRHECQSEYVVYLISAMLDDLIGDVKNLGDEALRNLGISKGGNKTEQSTDRNEVVDLAFMLPECEIKKAMQFMGKLLPKE